MPSKPSILFMGTPEFACIILAKILNEGFPILGVFAQPDKPKGRGQKLLSPPVAEFAKEKGLPLFQPTKIREASVLQQIKKLNPDFIIVAAYGKILPQELLDFARIDILNVHASLLPEYRGAAPINYALLDGKKKAGVSIMRVIKELDAGPVFFKKEIHIEPSDDASSLTLKLADLGAAALLETLDLILTKNLKPVDQDHSKASFAPKLSREISPICWRDSAEKIFNQIRALVPWPVASAQMSGMLLKIFSAEILPNHSQDTPGKIVHIGKSGWTVCTGTSDILIKELQLEGKKRMNAFDLANGLRLKVGEILA